MTEGPRAHALAYILNNHVAGKTLLRANIRSRKLRIPLEDIIGMKLTRAEAYGKNIVLIFGEYAMRIHTLIYGIVRLYKHGETIEKPEKMIRLKLDFEDYSLIGFNTPIIELDHADKIIKNLEKTLGPDPLRPEWNHEIVFKKIRDKKDEKIGLVLIDQGIIAGVGNILRNEALYRARINPERIVREISDEKLNELINIIEDLSKTFYNKLIKGENPRELYLVYNKYRGKCVYCGSPLKYYRQQPRGRKTFTCPNCQL